MANLETLHERANNALIDGENDKAEAIYNEILQSYPDDEIAYSQLMDLYYDTDKMKYYMTRANLNIVRSQLEHAINDCKKAININASEVQPHLKLARLYLTTKRNLKAIDEFIKVLDLNPEERSATLDLISLYDFENSVDSAVNVAKNAINVFKNNEEFKNILANLYFEQNDYKNAIEVAQDDFSKAKILLADDRNDEAKEILDKIGNKSPKKEELSNYNRLLSQYFYNISDYQKALDTLEEFKKSDKPSPVYFQMKALVYEGLEDEFSAYLNWGYCNKVRGKIEEAIMQFQQASNAKPDDKTSLIELAKLYEQNGEQFVCADYWKKVYELDNDETARKFLADFYYKQGDLRLAQKYGKEIEKRKEQVKNAENGENERVYDTPLEQDEGILNKIMKLFGNKG